MITTGDPVRKEQEGFIDSDKPAHVVHLLVQHQG